MNLVDRVPESRQSVRIVSQGTKERKRPLYFWKNASTHISPKVAQASQTQSQGQNPVLQPRSVGEAGRTDFPKMSSYEIRGQNEVTHAPWKLKSSVPAMELLRLSQTCYSIYFFHSHSDLFFLFHLRLRLCVLPVRGPCANGTWKVYPNSWAFDVGFATWFSYRLCKIISTIFFSHDIWFSVCTWIGLPGVWQNKMSLWVFPPHKSGS